MTAFIVTAASWVVACGSGEIVNSSPETAYDSYRAAMLAGELEKIHDLLIPEVTKKIDGTFDLNRQTMRLIEQNIPAPLRANFLDEIGPAAVRNAPGPAAYFAATVQPGRPGRASIGTRVSTKAIGCDETAAGSNKWLVRTLGGERINLQGGTDGLYYVIPANADSARINQELKNAEDRLVIQQQIAADLAHGQARQP